MPAADGVRIDDLARPRLPLPLRAANACLRPFARSLWPLGDERLLRTARRRTGLQDFGDPGFRKPLRVLLRALADEADLSALGRMGSRGLVLQLLSSRLLLEDLIRRHPEILEQRVERPLVIAGLPRTGTTHLHNLMSQDPALRSLPYWESLEPILPESERPAPGEADPRIERCRKALDLVDRVMPLFSRMHEMTAEGPHEEIQLLALDFGTMLFEASAQVPGYVAWYRTSDQTPAYAYLKRCLQALQWLRGGARWVLKSPQHLEQTGPLLATFPDAYIVQTHRDPVRITASLCTMIAYGHRMNARRVDPVAIGRHWARRVEDLLRASVLDRPLVPEGQVFDVRFHEFMKDDVAMVERVFAFAGQPWTEAAGRAIRDFMDANPRGKHGTLAYHLEDVGLDPGERRRALRFYQDFFEVPDEA